MKVLVYQAYGRDDVKRQTLFSVFSLLTFEDIGVDEVWIYTEDEDFFARYFANHDRVKCKIVSMEQIKKWRGAIDFVHRVKVEILIHAGQQFSGPLFYCDGDTYFTKSPKQIFATVDDQHSLMHIAENSLENGKDPLSKKIKKFVRKNSFRVGNLNLVVPIETMMWNAGVLGFSQANKELLVEVLELTDAMYSMYQKHVMEQLAFSFSLQKKTTVSAADHVIYHYWNQKDEYQAAIDQYILSVKSLPEALEKYKAFPFPAPPQTKPSIFQKIIKKLSL